MNKASNNMKESNVRECSLIKMMSNQNEYTTSLTNAMYPSKYCFISVETGVGVGYFAILVLDLMTRIAHQLVDIIILHISNGGELFLKLSQGGGASKINYIKTFSCLAEARRFMSHLLFGGGRSEDFIFHRQKRKRCVIDDDNEASLMPRGRKRHCNRSESTANVLNNPNLNKNACTDTFISESISNIKTQSSTSATNIP